MDTQSNVLSSGIRDKVKGALVFSAVGDALGWPTEFGRYPAEVEKRFGKRYLEDFISWEKMIGGKYWGYRETIKEGEYSDDTQLTLAVYRCIDENGDFNPDKFAYFELPLWLHYERGGGKTIKMAARKLNQSSKEWLNNFYTTKELSYRNAGANGAAMRVLPIALVNINNETRLYRDTFINSIITHGHPRAILGSVIYSSIVNFLVKEKAFSNESLFQYLRDTINNFSESFKGDDFIQKWVKEWDKKPLNGMGFKELFKNTRNESIDYLEGMKERIKLDDREFYKFTGALSDAYRGSGISTVLVAIYLFIKYLDNPEKAIYTAVNMLGSDTDTIANFVGGLLGAYYGLSVIPTKLIDRLQDKDYLLRLGEDLYNMITGETIKKYVSSKTFKRYDAYLKIMAWEIGLHEMFWDALHEGETIMHPALGKGVIKNKRVEALRREDYQVKLIEVSFDSGQTCVFHSRVSKDGELSESLAKDTKKILDSLERQGSTEKIFPVPKSLFDDIESVYEFAEGQREEIRGFLEDKKYLNPILNEIRGKIFSVFGKGAKLCLELHRDPEEDFERLFIIVKTNLSPDQALDLLDKFDEEWWLDIDDKVRKVLEVDVENIS